MTIREFYAALEERLPRSLSWDWDNDGISCAPDLDAPVTGVLIAISTVFVKQHSILDLLAALPFCAAAYALCFGIGWGVKKQEFFAA